MKAANKTGWTLPGLENCWSVTVPWRMSARYDMNGSTLTVRLWHENEELRMHLQVDYPSGYVNTFDGVRMNGQTPRAWAVVKLTELRDDCNWEPDPDGKKLVEVQRQVLTIMMALRMENG